MLGAIAGDIIGSVYEARPIKTTKFPLFHPRCRFTDDTVLTVALADNLMHGAPFVGLLETVLPSLPARWLRRLFPQVGTVGGHPPIQQLGKRLGDAGQPSWIRLHHFGRRDVTGELIDDQLGSVTRKFTEEFGCT